MTSFPIYLSEYYETSVTSESLPNLELSLWTQAGLELTEVHLCLPPECWNWRREPPFASGVLPTLKFEDAYGKVHGYKLCSHQMCERPRCHLLPTLNEKADEHRLTIFFQLEKSTCRKSLHEVLSECKIIFNKSRGEEFSSSKKHTVTSCRRWKQYPLGTWVLG